MKPVRKSESIIILRKKGVRKSRSIATPSSPSMYSRNTCGCGSSKLRKVIPSLMHESRIEPRSNSACRREFDKNDSPLIKIPATAATRLLSDCGPPDISGFQHSSYHGGCRLPLSVWSESLVRYANA
eukprot:COSAG02_NODE_6900_length_3292_cov_3.140625_3_plen_127_part_00